MLVGKMLVSIFIKKKKKAQRETQYSELTHLGAEFDLIKETFLGVRVHSNKVTTRVDDKDDQEHV